MMWTYKNEPFSLGETDEWYGYVYCITNLLHSKYYVGRKYFTFSKTKQIKGKKKKSRVASDWQDYWGSNKELIADLELYGKENFSREILHLCPNRAACSYYETREIMIRDALLRDNYYNSWCSCRIHKKHLMGKLSVS